MHGQPLSRTRHAHERRGSREPLPGGQRCTLERVIGHRDTGKTACPGDALYAQLDEIRALVESGAAVRPPSSARVTAALADQRVDYGELVPVSGALVGPDGSPLAGQPVEVQVNSENVWRTARRVTTGADGAFLTDLKPAQANVRAGALPGQRGRARRGLPAAAAAPAPGADALSRPPTRGVRGRRVEVAGTVGAAQARGDRGVPAADPRALAQGRHAVGPHAPRPLRDLVRAGVQGGVPLLRGRAVGSRHRPRRVGDAVAAVR